MALSILPLTLLAIASVSSFQSKHPDAVRVYIFTEQKAEAPPSEEEQGRLSSVEDLRDILGHRSGIVLVNTMEEAQVTVEVVNREERETAQGGYGGASFTKFRETIVRLRVKSGSSDAELKGVGQASWKAAAKDAAERLEKWMSRTVKKKAGVSTGPSPVA